MGSASFSRSVVSGLRGNSHSSAIHMLVCVGLLSFLTACSSHGPSQPAAVSSQPSQSTPASGLKQLADFNAAGKTPEQLSAYIFENHGCKNCHTMGKGGKLGFTERGKQVGKNFEGCISLLTSMNVIAQVNEENRTAEEKDKAVRFQDFGCTTCHQITPGKLGLTEYGTKLKSMHLACTEVQQLLASKK